MCSSDLGQSAETLSFGGDVSVELRDLFFKTLATTFQLRHLVERTTLGFLEQASGLLLRLGDKLLALRGGGGLGLFEEVLRHGNQTRGALDAVA